MKKEKPSITASPTMEIGLKSWKKLFYLPLANFCLLAKSASLKTLNILTLEKIQYFGHNGLYGEKIFKKKLLMIFKMFSVGLAPSNIAHKDYLNFICLIKVVFLMKGINIVIAALIILQLFISPSVYAIGGSIRPTRIIIHANITSGTVNLVPGFIEVGNPNTFPTNVVLTTDDLQPIEDLLRTIKEIITKKRN